MPIVERTAIVQQLKMVDGAILFNDNDDTAMEAIKNVRMLYPNDTIIFANGGDRTAINIPEMTVQDENLIFKFGVGGENKMNSSSWILQEWKAPKTERTWGYYRVLHEVDGCKVKELTVMPGQSLSLQRHAHRHELWHVTKGKCAVDQSLNDSLNLSTVELVVSQQIAIPQYSWHRLYNPYDEPCKIVEIQYGTVCIEEDIERIC